METCDRSRRARLIVFMWAALRFAMWTTQSIAAAIPKVPSKKVKTRKIAWPSRATDLSWCFHDLALE